MHPTGDTSVTVSAGTIHDDTVNHLRTLVGGYIEVGMLGTAPSGLSSAAAQEALHHADIVQSCSRHCASMRRVFTGLNGLLQRTRYSHSKGNTSTYEPLLADALDAPDGEKHLRTDPHLTIFQLISRVFLRERKKVWRDRVSESKKRRAIRRDPELEGHDRRPEPAPTNRLEDSDVFRALKLLLLDHKRIVGLVAAGGFRSSLRTQLGLLLLRETSLYPEYWGLADDPTLRSLEVKGVYDGSITGGGRLITLGDWLSFFGALTEVAALPSPTSDQQRGVQIDASERVLEYSTGQVRDLLVKAGWSHAWGNNGALDQEVSRAREKVQQRFGELLRGGQ